MDIKTYKIEQYKDGSWVGVASTNPNGSIFIDEYAGLTEDQTQDVIDYFVTTGISTSNLRATEETS